MNENNNIKTMKETRNMMLKRMLLLALPLLLSTPAVKAQGVQFVENKSLAEVLAEAKQADKLVFIDCYTSWCGPCKMMANQEFPKKEAGDYFNPKFINAKFDMEKGEGPDIQNKYGVHAYPTFLILNSDGELVHRQVGADDITTFIANLDKGLNGKTFSEYVKQYEGGDRSEAFLKDYYQQLEAQYLRDEAKAVAAIVLQGKQTTDLVNDSVLLDMYLRQPPVVDDCFKELCRHREEIDARYNHANIERMESVWKDSALNTFQRDTSYAIVAFDKAKYDDLLQQMEASGFGYFKPSVEQSAHAYYAWMLKHKAVKNGDAKAYVNVLKEDEPAVRQALSTQAPMQYYGTAAGFLYDLKELTKLAQQTKNKKALKYVKETVDAHESILRAKDTSAEQKYNLGQGESTLTDHLIQSYEKVLKGEDL